MPEPISLTTALLVAGGLKAAGGIASGVGQARAAKKMMLSPEEQKRLAELQERQARGELGLTERDRGVMEQRFLAEQAGAQRELEAAALQQAAARGLGGPISGREIFLAEQAEAGAEQEARQRQNLAVEEINRSEAAAQEATINAMVASQKAAEAQRIQGIANAFSLGFSSAGDTAGQYASMMHEAELARIQAEIKAGTNAQAQGELETPDERNFGMGTTG